MQCSLTIASNSFAPLTRPRKRDALARRLMNGVGPQEEAVTSQTSYKSLFDAAMKLISGSINLDGSPLSHPGFFERKRLNKGLTLLMQAAEIEPEYGAASLMAAKVEERLGRHDERLTWLRRAAVTAPGNSIVAIELGGALSQLGHQAEAVSVLSAAATANPEDPRVQSNLGIAQLLAGSVAESVAAFERLQALEPGLRTNERLLVLAQKVSAGTQIRPRSEAELIASL